MPSGTTLGSGGEESVREGQEQPRGKQEENKHAATRVNFLSTGPPQDSSPGPPPELCSKEKTGAATRVEFLPE